MQCHRCGFARVREENEVAALNSRLLSEQSAAERRGASLEWRELLEVAGCGQAVMCRPEKIALSLLEDDNALWRSYYHQIESGMRRPEETIIEKERQLADFRLFPYYREHISFAVLSANGLGPPFYGACALTFAEELIAHRATVFEENSVNFMRGLNFGELPPGHRATWQRRGQLAAAKLGTRLKPGMTSTAIQELLMTQSPSDSNPDFVETHIFESLHGSSIARIRFWSSKTDVRDESFRRQISKICENRKIEVDGYSPC